MLELALWNNDDACMLFRKNTLAFDVKKACVAFLKENGVEDVDTKISLAEGQKNHIRCV